MSAKVIRRRRLLIKPDKEAELERLIVEREKRGAEPTTIVWSGSTSSSLGAFSVSWGTKGCA